MSIARYLRLVVVAALVAAWAIAVAPAASSQTCDPNDVYCSTTSSSTSPSTSTPGSTPTSATFAPSCSASPTQAFSGDTVRAVASNVPAGTSVEFRLGGQTVATASSSASEAGTVGEAAATFTVPDLPPGQYELTAVGPGFLASCTAAGGFGVLGDATVAPPGGGGTGGDSLARTGIAVALLVAVAVAFIVVGRGVLEAGRRRRRAAARESVAAR